jgi:hypothetical protein
VKLLQALAFVLLLATSIASGQSNNKPFPAGIHEAEQHAGPADIPPAVVPKSARIDPGTLHRQALELAELAKALPSDIDLINRGILPKDVQEKLKRIEKLSKALRNEIGN